MIIDVSVYQGEINWAAIKADQIQLAIIKATEGIGFTDPRFAQNWAGAKAAGVPRGAYHFAHPDAGNNAISEATYFLGVVEAHGLDPIDLLAEDYEVLGGGAAWSLAFLGHLEGAVANVLTFYSNYSGCSRVNDPRMARYPLWLAYPGDGVHLPLCPKPWTSISLWQYRVGTVPGITGGVDEDAEFGLFGLPSHTVQEDPMHFVIDPNGVVYVLPSGRHIGPQEWAYWQAQGIKATPISAAFGAELAAAFKSVNVTQTVDLSPVTTAVAGVKSDTAAIIGKLDAAGKAL